jgi:hypothetical protein
MRARRTKRNAGQAIAEVVVGLVGLSCVLLAVYQFGLLGDAGIGALMNARAEADENAHGNLIAATNRNLLDWRNGADNLSYTADDEAIELVADDLTVYADELTEPLALSALGAAPALGLRDDVAPLLATNGMGIAAALFLGRETVFVPVDQALQPLLLGQIQWLTLREEVAMPGLDLRSGNP